MKRALVKYAGVAFAALAAVQAARLFGAGAADVRLVYEAPPGPLEITLTDEDGDRVRRTEFGAGAERTHVVRLPEGNFVARLAVPGHEPVERRFRIEEADRAWGREPPDPRIVTVRWRP